MERQNCPLREIVATQRSVVQDGATIRAFCTVCSGSVIVTAANTGREQTSANYQCSRAQAPLTQKEKLVPNY